MIHTRRNYSTVHECKMTFQACIMAGINYCRVRHKNSYIAPDLSHYKILSSNWKQINPSLRVVYVMLCLGQIDELKGCIEEREEELSRLRTATASVRTC